MTADAAEPVNDLETLPIAIYRAVSPVVHVTARAVVRVHLLVIGAAVARGRPSGVPEGHGVLVVQSLTTTTLPITCRLAISRKASGALDRGTRWDT